VALDTVRATVSYLPLWRFLERVHQPAGNPSIINLSHRLVNGS
jgi:hypothetical protein